MVLEVQSLNVFIELAPYHAEIYPMAVAEPNNYETSDSMTQLTVKTLFSCTEAQWAQEQTEQPSELRLSSITGPIRSIPNACTTCHIEDAFL